MSQWSFYLMKNLLNSILFFKNIRRTNINKSNEARMLPIGKTQSLEKCARRFDQKIVIASHNRVFDLKKITDVLLK